jgi:antitoxin HicB
MKKLIKIPLVLQPAAEGGWVVISPIIPELITEIDRIEDLEKNVSDAIEAVKELYDDMKKPFPAEEITDPVKPVWFEAIVKAG